MKPPRKTQKDWVWSATGLVNMPGGWCILVPQGQKLLHAGPFQPLPCAPLHLYPL